MLKSLILSSLSSLSVLTGAASSLLNSKLESEYKSLTSSSFLKTTNNNNIPTHSAWALLLNSGSFSYLAKLINQLNITPTTAAGQLTSSGNFSSSAELYTHKLQQLVNTFLGDLSWTHLIEVLDEQKPQSNSLQPSNSALNSFFPEFKSNFLSLNQWLELFLFTVIIWILSCLSLSGSALFFCSSFNKLERKERVKLLIYYLLTQLPGWLFKYRAQLSKLRESESVSKSRPLFSGNVNAFSVSNLNYSIGATEILKKINLTLKKNEFYAIIGSNGAGKTTLLKHLGRLLTPSKGKVLVGAQELFSISDREFWKKVVYIPQELSIPPDTPVYDFLLSSRFVSMQRAKKASPIDHLKVLLAIKRCQLHQLRWAKIGDLSGGQRQKVVLASILVKDAELILLDEPTSFLDIENRNFLVSFFRELHYSGKTIIANLHSFYEITQLATTVIAMKRGELQQIDKKEKLLEPSFLNYLYDLSLSKKKWDSLLKATQLNY